MTIQPKYLAPVTFFHDVAGDGYTPVPFVAGGVYASQIIDRTVSPTFAEFVTLTFSSTEAETLSGEVDIYVYSDIGPGGPPGENGENWIFWPVVLANAASPKWSVSASLYGVPISTLPLKLVGTMTLANAGWHTRPYTFNVASVFGGIVPPRWAVVVHNKSTFDLGGEGPNGQKAWGQVVGVVAESV